MSYEKESTKNLPLHICPECSGEFVQDIGWEGTKGINTWQLWRWCPECEWEGNDVVNQKEIERYDEVVEDGFVALKGISKKICEENMNEFSRSFVVALRQDLISADDFLPRKL